MVIDLDSENHTKRYPSRSERQTSLVWLVGSPKLTALCFIHLTSHSLRFLFEFVQDIYCLLYCFPGLERTRRRVRERQSLSHGRGNPLAAG